jgi:glycerophosphoryl diester phosphodiesterase
MPEQSRIPIAISHRYGNSVAQITTAAAVGAAFVECDVWCSRGVLEVRHAKTLGPIPVLWDKWYVKVRPSKALLLNEVLAALPAGMGIMIDLKGDDRRAPEMLLDALRGLAGDHPVMVSARFWDHLPSLRVLPELMLFHSVGSRRQLQRVRPLLRERERDAVVVQYRLLDADVVRSLREQVSMVATWPVNTDERLARAVEWGIDAVITDSLEIVQRLPPFVQV